MNIVDLTGFTTEKVGAENAEKEKSRPRVTVRAPATTANLGPGYDVVGIALDVWNTLTLIRLPGGVEGALEVVNRGVGADFLPTDETNLAVRGALLAYKIMQVPPPGLRFECDNAIPFARGMGSSSAGIVSGILAALALEQHALKTEHKEELLQLACKIEGHPDNVAPVIYGGFQLGMWVEQSHWWTSRVRIPHGLVCVLFVPDTTTETAAARALLQDNVPRSEAVFNLSRTGLLVNAFASNHLEHLRFAMDDRLHQPQRGAAVHPHMYPLIDAAVAAGAHGAALSGSGPTIIALTSGRRGDVLAQSPAERAEKRVAEAMLCKADEIGCAGHVIITKPVEIGAHIVMDGMRLDSDSRIDYR